MEGQPLVMSADNPNVNNDSLYDANLETVLKEKQKDSYSNRDPQVALESHTKHNSATHWKLYSLNPLAALSQLSPSSVDETLPSTLLSLTGSLKMYETKLVALASVSHSALARVS